MKTSPASSSTMRDEQLARQHQLVSSGAELKNKEEAIRGKAPAETSEFTPSDLGSALEQINRTSEAMNISLRFKLHDKSERIMVEIIDVKKNEILKEIPPEHVLNMVAQIQDMIGLMLDEKR